MNTMGTFEDEDFDVTTDADTDTPLAAEAQAAVQGDSTGAHQAVEVTGEPTDDATGDATDEQPAELTAEEAAAKEKAEKAEAKAAADKEYEEVFTAFKQEVQAAVNDENVDPSTGSLPKILLEAVNLAYSKLPGAKGKNAGKAYLQETMHEQMVQFDPTDHATTFRAIKARSYLELYKFVTAAKNTSESPIAKQIDPTEAHVARVVAALVAPNLILPPDGIADDWRIQSRQKAESLAPQVEAYRNWLMENVGKTGDDRSAEPEVDDIVKAAAKIALGRATGAGRKPRATSTGGGTTSAPYTGTRRDIGKHIAEAFADEPVGKFLTIAEIAKFESSEYGNDHPSSGAVSARLFPKSGDCTVPGVRGDIQGNKGGLKFEDA